MKNKEELRDELKNLSPFLAEQKGKPEGFDVPTDYFKSLPDEIFNKLKESQKTVIEKKESWFDQLLNTLQYYLQPRYAMAYASVVVILVAGIYFINNTNIPTEQPMLAEAILNEVPDEILQAYISENIDEFDEAILTAELADQSSEPLPELKIENPDELLDELIDETDIDDLEDLL